MNLFENLQHMNESSFYDDYEYDENNYDNNDYYMSDDAQNVINRYNNMYNDELNQLSESNTLSFHEFCKKFDDHIKQSFDTVTGEEDSYKKYPSSFNQHQTYAYDDYLNGTSYFEDEMLEETTSSHEKYSYAGPVYRFDRIINNVKEPIFTVATSVDKAYNNFCYRLKKELGLERGQNLTLNKNNVKLVEPEYNENDFEEISKKSEPVLNDPKYNFEDPDREDDYTVESKCENISLSDLQNAIGATSFMSDRAYIKIDGEEYIKIGNNKWQYHPSLAHALPTTYTDEKMLEIIRKSNDAKLYNVDNSLVEDFEVNDTEQEYTSAKTSINSGKLPAIFKLINLKPGTVNLDFGGGKYNNVAEYYADKDVTNLVYDPYNRSSEHNAEVLKKIREIGGVDSCTLSNVLNVIKEPQARKTCLQNCYNLLKSGGDMFITVYEGNGSGEDKATSSGYQLNKKTADYLEEIKEVFPNAKRKGKLIYATK